MFTVMIGREGSGNSRTRSPFGRAYSVIPSTCVTRSTFFGSETGFVPVSLNASEESRNTKARTRDRPRRETRSFMTAHDERSSAAVQSRATRIAMRHERAQTSGMKLRALILVAAVSLLALPACEKKTLPEKVDDKVDDALDRRP